jgi:hypothetical protein
MFMRNKFGWDKEVKAMANEEEKFKTFDRLADAISGMQKAHNRE